MQYETAGSFRPGKTASPCYGCENRTVGCHGSCELYKVYAEKKRELSRRNRNEWGKMDTNL